MKVTCYFRCLVAYITVSLLLANSHGQRLETFAQALMQNLGSTNPAIILSKDDYPAWSMDHHNSVTLVGVPYIQADAEDVIDHLHNLITADEIDFVLFMTPNASEILTMVAEELGELHPKIVMLMPMQYPVSYPLRLDSRLFLYKTSEESITLFEKYYIR